MNKTVKDVESLNRKSFNVGSNAYGELYKIPEQIREVRALSSTNAEKEDVEKTMNRLIESSFVLECMIKEIRALIRKDNEIDIRFTRTPEVVTGKYIVELYADDGNLEPVKAINENGVYKVVDILSVNDTRITERIYAVQIHVFETIHCMQIPKEKLLIDYNWLRAMKANADKALADCWHLWSVADNE